MLERALVAGTFAAAIGSGLVAGIFFAFSTFVMAALGRLAPEQGMAAMNAINVTVINPLFMLAFLGTGGLCLALAIASWGSWGQADGVLLLAAAVLYLIGCVGVTMVCNVPLNDALAAAPAGGAAALALWADYLKTWTFWNHVRTLASLGAAIVFVAVLMLGRDR
ncbi:anthrone oxygenase family protein [Bradyrhizobium sp. 2TAF24]|uniref:anthrone oxygenase family protein n=1 Tax=Bradyrhizobium sp. 2TAF24 TaxID=3233011 RepID=UPI003F91C6B7